MYEINDFATRLCINLDIIHAIPDEIIQKAAAKNLGAFIATLTFSLETSRYELAGCGIAPSLPPEKEYLTQLLSGVRLRHKKLAFADKVEKFGLRLIQEHQRKIQQERELEKNRQEETRQKELLKKATRCA